MSRRALQTTPSRKFRRVKGNLQLHLPVDVFFRLQPFYQAINLWFLRIGCALLGDFHFLDGVIELSFRRIDARQARMHNPRLWVLRRIRAEYFERLLIVLLQYQLPTIGVRLLHGRFIQRLRQSSFRFFRVTLCLQYSRSR